MDPEQLTKYEKARILGARALQIAMNAPLLVKLGKEDLEEINYDPINIAEIELNSKILPISIKKPMPLKREEKLRRAKEVKLTDEKKLEMEEKEEEEIIKEGEIMALANPEDEQDDGEDNGSEE